MNHPVNQRVNQQIQLLNPVDNLPCNRLSNLPVNQPLIRQCNQPLNRLCNLRINHLHNLPINQVDNRQLNLLLNQRQDHLPVIPQVSPQQCLRSIPQLPIQRQKVKPIHLHVIQHLSLRIT
jgi:hypothetical protein